MTRSVVDEAPFEGRKNELLAIAWMAFSIFVVVSLYSTATGVVGATLSSWLKKALGDSAVVPALFLFGYGVLILRKKRWPDLYRRLTAVTLMYGAGLTAYHLLVVESTSPVTPYWARKIGEDGGGSGWLGGIISAFLLNAIGIFGSVVLLLACFFAGVVLISDRSDTGAPWVGRIGHVLARSGRGVLGFAAGIKGEVVQLGQAVAAGKERRKRRRAEKSATLSETSARRPGLRQRRAARRARRERRQAAHQAAASMAAPIYDQDNDAFHRLGTVGYLDDAADADTSYDDVETDTFASATDDHDADIADLNGHMVSDSAAKADEWPPTSAPATEDGIDRRGEATSHEGATKLGPATGAPSAGVRTDEGEKAATSTVSGTAPSTSVGTGTRRPAGDAASKPSTGTGGDYADYRLPSPSLLERSKTSKRHQAANEDQSQLLVDTLATFGVETKIVAVNRGPVVTRYELQPAPGVKVSRIVNLADDVSLNLAAAGVRIEAPVPGKSVVGIEVPNKHTSTVSFRDLVESPEFTDHPSKIAAALGKDIAGNPVIADMTKVLHLLIAGATGSGKSVCINTLICSILYKARPDEVKLLMIDPKRVELAVYDGIPHLITPVVTDPKLAANALRWAVKEMEDRYKAFSEHGVRNIAGYNQEIEAGTIEAEPMPYIAVIIDELADLMLVAGNEVEDAICRLAQMARAAGIHLVIATQRPSVDVITGLIKANVPSRLSFAVSSGVDSRTILDMMGAERLIGKGDMLYYPIGMAKPVRAQGAFISDREVRAIVNACKKQAEPDFVENVAEPERQTVTIEENDDELYDDAVRLVVEAGSASISMIQRRFRVGYARAARLIDMMELAGVVGPYQGSKPRDVLKSADDVFGDELAEQEAAHGASADQSPDDDRGDELSEAVNN